MTYWQQTSKQVIHRVITKFIVNHDYFLKRETKLVNAPSFNKVIFELSQVIEANYPFKLQTGNCRKTWNSCVKSAIADFTAKYDNCSATNNNHMSQLTLF